MIPGSFTRKIGAGLGTGPTTDTNLAAAAASLTQWVVPNPPCPQGVAVVEAFQTAWNASTDTTTTGGTQLAVDGSYGPDTVAALTAAVGPGVNVQAACTSFIEPTPPTPTPQSPATTGGMPTWLKILLWALVAGGAVTLAYWLWKKHKKSGAREKKKRGKKRK